MAKVEKKPVEKKEKPVKTAAKPAVKKAVKKPATEKSTPAKKKPSGKVRELAPKSDKTPQERRLEAMETTLAEGNSKIAAMMAQISKVSAVMTSGEPKASTPKSVEKETPPWEDLEPGMVEVKTATPMMVPESTDPYVHGQKKSFLDSVVSEKKSSIWGDRQPTQNGMMKMSSVSGRVEEPVKVNRTSDGKIRLSDLFSS